MSGCQGLIQGRKLVQAARTENGMRYGRRQ